MGCEVYANNDEIACKAGDGKVIAAFPDVCLSPPSPPAGPIPVPYPDTSFSKDMQSGSKTVKIKGKEVMLKDQSFYKTSPLGDEAATRGLGAGVITHVITGKTYFIAWSMDVKIEGQNVDRHTDLTTSNHASPGGNSAPGLNLSKLSLRHLATGKCPCCGKEGCAAAPKSGEDNTPQNFEDHCNINEKDGKGQPTERAIRNKKKYEEIKRRKKEECTCDGEIFPQPPCNVFRPPNAARTKRIEAEWDRAGQKEKYADEFRTRNPTAIRDFVKKNPKEPPPPKKGAFKKVNHLTPKSAGGCPTNRQNLQPNDLLCKTCKKLDTEIESLFPKP
jgi:hypothetical protein